MSEHKRKRLTPKDVERIKELLSLGMSRQKVADFTEFSNATVSRVENGAIVVENGEIVYTQNVSGSSRRKGAADGSEIEALADLVLEEMQQQREILGCILRAVESIEMQVLCGPKIDVPVEKKDAKAAQEVLLLKDEPADKKAKSEK